MESGLIIRVLYRVTKCIIKKEIDIAIKKHLSGISATSQSWKVRSQFVDIKYFVAAGLVCYLGIS